MAVVLGKWSKAWALVYPEGYVAADTRYDNEEEVWAMTFGRLTHHEINAAKGIGYRAVQIDMYIPERSEEDDEGDAEDSKP